MKKTIFAAALAMLLLAGCNAPSASSPITGSKPEPTPEPVVDIGGTELSPDTEALDLTAMEYDYDVLLAVSGELTGVKNIELGEVAMPYEQFAALQEAFPDAELSYTVSLFGETVDLEVEKLDLSDMQPEQADELAAVVPFLKNLKEINFVNENSETVFNTWNVSQLEKVRQAAPDVYYNVWFDLFGQVVTPDMERVEFECVPIGNDGIQYVRQVLPFLKNCTYFLMDGCGVDNEVMAQLRDDFPETKIVWRVWLTEPDYYHDWAKRILGFLTDTTRIRSTYVTNENCHVLNYCTETKYLDVGHIVDLTDFSFITHMPELEVAIVAITGIDNLDMFTYCPKLEYLEICSTIISDLSPLANCTNLKNLNTGFTKINDITPLYGLDLDRLWVIATLVPDEQFEEYKSLHPDCVVQNEGLSPFHHGWRWDEDFTEIQPRYDLLRQQMEYDIDAMYGIP